MLVAAWNFAYQHVFNPPCPLSEVEHIDIFDPVGVVLEDGSWAPGPHGTDGFGKVGRFPFFEKVWVWGV